MALVFFNKRGSWCVYLSGDVRQSGASLHKTSQYPVNNYTTEKSIICQDLESRAETERVGAPPVYKRKAPKLFLTCEGSSAIYIKHVKTPSQKQSHILMS